jgi:hypothetical protein
MDLLRAVFVDPLAQMIAAPDLLRRRSGKDSSPASFIR